MFGSGFRNLSVNFNKLALQNFEIYRLNGTRFNGGLSRSRIAEKQVRSRIAENNFVLGEPKCFFLFPDSRNRFCFLIAEKI